MRQTVTQEDLIRFYYKETNAEETQLITDAIEHDWELKESYSQIIMLYRAMRKERFSPNQTSIDIILAYSRDTAPLETI